MITKTLLQTETALSFVKETFPSLLASALDLSKISSPLVVLDGTGINDDLNGTERPVAFPIKAMQEQRAVVVHSLAKWKRQRLHELEIPEGQGLLTDMRALRPDEDFTPLHSIYVDQWDWEKHISHEKRSTSTLKETVKAIYACLVKTEKMVEEKFGIKAVLPSEIQFIHSEELLQRYPTLSPKERESMITKELKAVFILGIGGALSDGEKHDGRAPDYDDWTTTDATGLKGLNGDILVWHPELKTAFEISSMGIRVDKKALEKQLEISDCKDRVHLDFHKKLLSDTLPQSIGGGIGQSRVCMFMLKKVHIGEVQVGIWPEAEIAALKSKGVHLL